MNKNFEYIPIFMQFALSQNQIVEMETCIVMSYSISTNTAAERTRNKANIQTIFAWTWYGNCVCAWFRWVIQIYSGYNPQ